MKTAPLLLALASFYLPAQAQWTAFCSGTTNGFIVDLEVFQDTLYATGFFNQICSQTGQRVAKYDGADWIPVGGGATDGGHTIAELNGDLYLAQYQFANAGNHVLRLDNGVWTPLGDAIGCITSG